VTKRFIELVKQSPIATEKFINHCIEVYGILKKQNESEQLCNAGLYHSIYGTCYFNDTVQTIENDRDLIKSEIGEYAEELVYKMSVLNDGENDIIRGNFNWDIQTLSDIIKICKANLISLNSKNSDYYIQIYDIMLELLGRGINPFSKNSVENDIKIMDNLFPYQFVCSLYSFTRNSNYSCAHASTIFSKYKDLTTRFACQLSKEEFIRTGLIPYMRRIANELGQDLFLVQYYIGHYTKSTATSAHVDVSNSSNGVTILIYPNLEWDDMWAGDIKFYSEDSPFHKVVDFKPGRVIVFDSSIKHKVMPLSSLAQIDRFSFSIKARTFSALSILSREQLKDVIHIPCT
jgi:hypothetical protein